MLDLKTAEESGVQLAEITCGPDASNCITTALHQFAESLGTAIDAKDSHTSLHSDEVAEVAHALALTMGLSAREADIIHVAGHLHDIGKIGVPDSVLKKKGPLNPEEWVEIRKHPESGAAILKPVTTLQNIGVVDMVLHHHERFDGQGYPHKLKGEDIPLGARIITLADSLSAMMQNRPYRRAKDFEKARAEIIKCSGTQFDPGVVEAFRESSDIIYHIMLVLSQSEGTR